MKRLLIIGLLLSICLTGCNKPSDTADNTENTETEVILVPDEVVEETAEPTLEEQLGIEPIEGLELVSVEIDGEEISYEEAQSDKNEITHIPIDGEEDIKIQDNCTGVLHEEILSTYNNLDPENGANPMMITYPDELLNVCNLIDDNRKDGVFNLADFISAVAFRSSTVELCSDPNDIQKIVRVYYPLTDSDNISFTLLANSGILSVEGTYDELWLNRIYAAKQFHSFRVEYYDNVYEAHGPISKDKFEKEYKPYAEQIKTDYSEYYVLKNNVDGCKGSFTVFLKIDDNTYMPYSIGSKVEPLDANIDFKSVCDFMSTIIVVESYTFDDVNPIWGF